jgi:amidase
MQAQIWGAVGSADYEAVTSLSGEPIIGTMTAEVENFDAPPERATHRPPPLNLTAYQYWQVNIKQRELRQSYLDHWRETAALTGTGRPVDAIICPMAPYAAPPHGTNRWVSLRIISVTY